MPLIDCRCLAACPATAETDHIREVMRPLSMYPATPSCPECGAATEQVHLPPRSRWTLDPVIVFRDADGSFRFPGGTDAVSCGKYERAGLERIELRSAADVRRFEGVMNVREYARASRRVERAQQQRELRESHTRSELHHLMQSMSPAGRAIARAAIARNNAKPLMRAREAGFHVDAFSNDRSNRETSRDGQGRRRRD